MAKMQELLPLNWMDLKNQINFFFRSFLAILLAHHCMREFKESPVKAATAKRNTVVQHTNGTERKKTIV